MENEQWPIMPIFQTIKVVLVLAIGIGYDDADLVDHDDDKDDENADDQVYMMYGDNLSFASARLAERGIY